MPDRTASARSFVLDLLSTLRRGSMPVRALVEAAALFGIAGGSVRVALSRLLADGLVERDERGAYRLGVGAEPVRRRVAAWRDLASQLRPWSGTWAAVVDAPAPTPTARRRSERALELLGFRALRRGLRLRPDNLAGGLPRLRERRTAAHAIARVGVEDLDEGVGLLALAEIRLGDLDVHARRV